MDAAVLSMGQKAVSMALVLSAPFLVTGLVVGLVISVFQAATQIQEMTISFVPKIVAVVLAGVVFGPWLLKVLVSFTRELLTGIPELVR